MKKKFVRDISASTVQVLLNQLAGVVIFYITSRYLDKKNFGELNWSLAVLMTGFNILGFGIDQIIVKKVAAKNDAALLLRLYLGHVLFTGILFYLLLIICQQLFPLFFNTHNLLLMLAISQLFSFFSSPFKQLATGEERFRLLMYLSVTASIIKAVGLIVLLTVAVITPFGVIALFMAGSFIELLVCLYFYRSIAQKPLIGMWKIEYFNLIRESLPQLGSVIFNSAVARFDWIFLGLLSTSVILAEYSFAYKVFELSSLPLIVLAPLLLPRFTRFFNDKPDENQFSKTAELAVLLRMEMIIASLIVLILNIIWTPVIDFVTNNKYGAANAVNIFILTACMPFLYINNFMWTVNFAQGRLHRIFWIISTTFLINVIGDILLIPFLYGKGAAIAYFIAIVIQTVLYLQRTKTSFSLFNKLWQSLLFAAGGALISGFAAFFLFRPTGLRLLCSLSIFVLILLAGKQIRRNDWLILKKTIGI
jgi:O-antigen/teichoic acid export membrane protein